MQTPIRLLLQEQSDLGLHCLHMSFYQTHWCIKFKDIYRIFSFFFYFSMKMYTMHYSRLVGYWVNSFISAQKHIIWVLIRSTLPKFVCVEVLRRSQPNGVMSSAVSLPKHTFTGQALSSKWLTSIVHILSPEKVLLISSHNLRFMQKKKNIQFFIALFCLLIKANRMS